MSEPAQIHAAGAKDLVTFTLKAAGQAVPDTIRIGGITVFKGIGRIPFARIEILDGDPAAQTFEVSASDAFVPGNELELFAGYRSQETLLFKGLVVSQQLRVRTPGPNMLTVYARHPLFKATLTRRSRTFSDATDNSAIEAILSEHGVTLSNSAAGLPSHERLVQWQCADWDFALSRAEANGLFLVPTDGGAELAPPVASGDPALSLEFGATVIELDAEMDARTQPSEATGLTWDPAAQEPLASGGSEPSLPSAGNLNASALAGIHEQPDHVSHPAAVQKEDLDAYTSARLLRRRLARIHGRVRCEGTPDPLPGTLLKLSGLGARFSGSLLISAVRHTFSRGAWHTDVQFGLPPKPLLEGSEEPGQPAAAGMLPSIQGLVIGLVTAIHADPAAELRVQISVPSLGENADPLWARLAKLDAGNGRGAFFFPEVGDEVVVGFVADDPRHPVILGSLYSSGQPAPLEPEENNPEKGYISREGLEFLFNDETKSIVLRTPNGNVVELSDGEGGIRLQDENGNKIVLNSEGITIESASEITLKSSADTTIEAGANLDLTAAAQLTASGSASAEFSASGSTTIKGAVVQIN
ncbi:MAG: type VI secretion system tip protein VgrG [Opitutales bacterium]